MLCYRFLCVLAFTVSVDYVTSLQCPYNRKPRPCRVNPCRVGQSPCPAITFKCQVDYCNDCTALWLDKSGRYITPENCPYSRVLQDSKPRKARVSRKTRCYMPRSRGFCEDMRTSWYFDVTQGQCRRFAYSGCGGNANRFMTLRACREYCGGTRPAYINKRGRGCDDCYFDM